MGGCQVALAARQREACFCVGQDTPGSLAAGSQRFVDPPPVVGTLTSFTTVGGWGGGVGRCRGSGRAGGPLQGGARLCSAACAA